MKWAAYTGGLKADVLHCAQIIVHDDEVAHHERLVEHNGKRGKQVPDDVLDGQATAIPPIPKPAIRPVISIPR